jgi:hypothetical protein
MHKNLGSKKIYNCEKCKIDGCKEINFYILILFIINIYESIQRKIFKI